MPASFLQALHFILTALGCQAIQMKKALNIPIIFHADTKSFFISNDLVFQNFYETYLYNNFCYVIIYII